jgi:hypothetical protein
MPWSVSYSDELDAVLTVYAGALPANALSEAIEATITLAQERGTTRFLGDCSGLQGGHSIGDLYDLANLLEAFGLGRGVREAIILPQLSAQAQDVHFWETICLNRGYTVRVFATMLEAQGWLVGQGEDVPRG